MKKFLAALVGLMLSALLGAGGAMASSDCTVAWSADGQRGGFPNFDIILFEDTSCLMAKLITSIICEQNGHVNCVVEESTDIPGMCIAALPATIRGGKVPFLFTNVVPPNQIYRPFERCMSGEKGWGECATSVWSLCNPE